jgi:excisionase family DNA binding protein
VLLTLDEVAQQLRVSSRTVRRLISSGRLPATAVNPGSRRKLLRVRQEDLDAFQAPGGLDEHAPLPPLRVKRRRRPESVHSVLPKA